MLRLRQTFRYCLSRTNRRCQSYICSSRRCRLQLSSREDVVMMRNGSRMVSPLPRPTLEARPSMHVTLHIRAAADHCTCKLL